LRHWAQSMLQMTWAVLLQLTAGRKVSDVHKKTKRGKRGAGRDSRGNRVTSRSGNTCTEQDARKKKKKKKAPKTSKLKSTPFPLPENKKKEAGVWKTFVRGICQRTASTSFQCLGRGCLRGIIRRRRGRDIGGGGGGGVEGTLPFLEEGGALIPKGFSVSFEGGKAEKENLLWSTSLKLHERVRESRQNTRIYAIERGPL